MWDYGSTLEQRLAADARQGRRVLLSHGTAPLLRAGITGVPRDRANSYLELLVAAQTDLAGTAGRIQQRFYDRIYLHLAEFYGPDIERMISDHYTQIGEIDGAPGLYGFEWIPDYLRYYFGYQGLMGQITVWEKKPD